MKLTQFLSIAVLSLALGACSGDNDYTMPDPYEGYLKVDYIIDTEYLKSLTITEDNSIYTLVNGSSVNSPFLSLKRISSTGELSTLRDLPFNFLGFMGISHTSSGEIYWVSGNSQYGRSIYSFTEDYSPIEKYKLKFTDSPWAKSPRLSEICNMGDNTFVVFDRENFSLKRYIPELNTDILIAGSEKKGMIDGSGLEAGFGYVSKILVQDKIIYVLDGGYIRKIEGNQVTTLQVNNIGKIIDIAIDSNQDIYAIVSGYGIQKLAKGSHTFKPYKEGSIDITDGKRGYSGFYFSEIYIKNNDLYLQDLTHLVKISDFKNKL